MSAFLAIVGASLLILMHEMAARAAVEASHRLRRAVYHHTFRLGTLAFRALGPTEAVSVFTRHVEAVHDALYTRLTVYFREPIKFGLLLAFALVVQPLAGPGLPAVRRPGVAGRRPGRRLLPPPGPAGHQPGRPSA